MSASPRFVIYDRFAVPRRGRGAATGGRTLLCRRWAALHGHDVLAGAVYLDAAPAGRLTTTLHHAIDTCLRFSAHLLVYDVDVLAELPTALLDRLHAESVVIWCARTGEQLPRLGVFPPAPAADARVLAVAQPS